MILASRICGGALGPALVGFRSRRATADRNRSAQSTGEEDL